MTARVFVFALLLLASASARAQAPSTVDPVGTWAVSTVSDEGQPMTVTMTVSGKPGAYTGQAVNSLGRILPLRELATTPIGFLAIFELPQGIVLVRIVRDGGKYTGAWGVAEQTFALTAEKAK